MQKIYWGIISEGAHTKSLIQALTRHAPSQLVALSTQNPDLGKSLQQHWHIPKYHADYESLIIDEDVNCVFIDTPLATRTSLTRASLSYKKNVLCTSPMCNSNTDLTDVLNQADTQNCLLQEAMLACFMPPIQRILDVIATGGIGELMHIQASASQHISFDPENPFFDTDNGGICYNIGQYPLMLTILLLGKPNTLTGHVKHGATSVEEEYALLLDYQQGQSALLFASSAINDAHQAHIYGTKARIHLHAPFYGQTRVSMYNKQRQSGLMKFNYEYNPHYYAIDDFYQSLATKQQDSVHWSHEHSKLLMQLIEQTKTEVPIRTST